MLGWHQLFARNCCKQLVQTAKLILGESFGGKEIKDAGIWIGNYLLDGRQVVAQGFAAGGACGYDKIFSI